jgi:tetratricopeptide (TPR) repeat protein
MDSLSGPRADPVAADELSEIERAKALVEQAHAARNTNARHGVALAREAVDIARHLGQRHILARALSNLSACLRGISELVEAARCAREAAGLFEQLDDASGEALAQINSGIALSMVGQMSDALWSFERARDLNQRLHNRIGEADALMDIAVIYNMLGDDAQALSLYDEVLPRRIANTRSFWFPAWIPWPAPIAKLANSSNALPRWRVNSSWPADSMVGAWKPSPWAT